MKQILFSIILLSGLILSNGDYLTKDTLDTNRVNIRSKTGEIRGYLKQDLFLFPDRWIIYDKMGTRKGYFKRDSLSPDRWKFRKGVE